MNKLMKAILVVVTLFASSAFAQGCINGGYIMGRGQQCWNHVNVDNGNGVRYGQQLRYDGNQVVRYANEEQMIAAQVRIQSDGQYNGQQIGNQQQFQLVHRERECTDGERHQRSLGNAVAGMVIGGGIGYARDNNRNSAGKGALIGALLLGGLSEVASCRIRYTERIAVGNQNLRQVGNQQNEGVVQCRDFGRVSVNDCVKLLAASNGGQTITTSDESSNETNRRYQRPVVAESIKSNAPFWGWYPFTASPSNKMKCFVTKQVAGQPDQCSSVQVEPSQEGETENAWRDRMSKLI